MLLQIVGLLKQIDDQIYTQPIPLFKGATLGQHFRHILGFYQCLLNGIAGGVIDYESRDRDPDIENFTESADKAFTRIFGHLDWLEIGRRLEVRTGFSTRKDVEEPLVISTVGRELMYAFDHSLHHLAMIRIGLQVMAPHLELEDNIGVAPSTVKYRAGQ